MKPSAACRRRFILLASMVGALVLLVSCSDDPAGPDEVTIRALTLDKDSAAPGEALVITGLTANDAAADSLTVEIDGLFAPAVRGAGLSLVTAAPLYLGNDRWPSPPADAVDVTVRIDGVLKYRLSGALQITELTEAPGTAAAIEAPLAAAAADLAEVRLLLEHDGTIQDQYLSAFLAALEALISGEDESSLASSLAAAAEDPAQAKLLDALLAQCGVTEYVTGLAALTAQMKTAVADKAAPPTQPFWSTGADDYILARDMQLYCVMKLFADEVIASTTTTFNLLVGTISGALGLADVDVPFVQVVMAGLTLVDFTLRHLMVSAMPAHIDSITIDLAELAMAPGDTTQSILTITASNVPVPLTLQEMIADVLQALGLPGSNHPSFLVNLLNFLLTTTQNEIAAYAGSHPDANLDADLLALVPSMTWMADAENWDLWNLATATPGLIAALDDRPEWRAKDDVFGEAALYVTPAAGAGVVLWNLPIGFTYAGGSFGNDMTPSATVHVMIAEELGLEVSFPALISSAGAASVDVHAGDRENDGSITGLPDIEVEVTVIGGTPGVSNGRTNANGNYSLVIAPDAGVNQVDVFVTVVDAVRGRGDTQQVTARVYCDGSGCGCPNTSLCESGIVSIDGLYGAPMDPYGSYLLESECGSISGAISNGYGSARTDGSYGFASCSASFDVSAFPRFTGSIAKANWEDSVVIFPEDENLLNTMGYLTGTVRISFSGNVGNYEGYENQSVGGVRVRGMQRVDTGEDLDFKAYILENGYQDYPQGTYTFELKADCLFGQLMYSIGLDTSVWANSWGPIDEDHLTSGHSNIQITCEWLGITGVYRNDGTPVTGYTIATCSGTSY